MDAPNELGGAIQTDHCSFLSDPLYRAASVGNLRLRAQSTELINRGDNTLVASDFTDMDDDANLGEYTPREQGFGWSRFLPLSDPRVDIGAYEFLPNCPYDIDGDGFVNVSDLAFLLGCYGLSDCTAVTDCCTADITLDGAVNLTDLATLLANFGAQCAFPLGTPGGGDLLAPDGGEASRPAASAATASASDPLADWLRSATIDEILAWYHAGMPPIEAADDR